MKQKVCGILAICLGAILLAGLWTAVTGTVSAKTAPTSPSIPVLPDAQPLAELKPGTYQVTFEYVATEMVTFWHTTSPDFEWEDWDKFVWTPGSFTFTVDDPVTLYLEGFGCYPICGKVRNLTISPILME